MSDDPKQIVYLIGAGATQAEISYLGAPLVNLLMRDSDTLGEGVSTRILKALSKQHQAFLGPNAAEDIEKLISLLSACGVERMSALAEELRKRYFRDICSNLPSAIVQNPTLAIGLLEMHRQSHFRKSVESLSGLLTTNHDGLFQVASQKVHAAVNLGFPFSSSLFADGHSTAVPFVLQLHGSFTWRFSIPMKVTPLRSRLPHRDTVWIPPTISKDSTHFPFNKMTALAYECLVKRCDVLRVIGASLTQNDWNVLSLIFNAQRHRELLKGSAFRIELIMSQKTGTYIQSQCSYLKNILPIGFLSEGRFDEFKQDDNPPADSELHNPFAYWLKQKILFHRGRGDLGGETVTEVMAKIVGEAQ